MTDLEKKLISRRDFMKGTATTALAAAVGLPMAEAAEKRSKVVLVRDARVLDAAGKIDSSVLGRMLDQAVAKLMGESSADPAWKRLVKPTDYIGVKSNHWNRLPTPTELEDIIMKRMIAAGVKPARVFCDDRGSRDKFDAASGIINVRPARVHNWSGIGSCLKNYIILTPKPSDYHPDSCAALGSIWHLPIVEGKTRLNIQVLLTPHFYGRGPQGFDPRYVWPYKGIAVSLDPVAVDAVAAHLLKTKRIKYFGEEQPITPTKHIEIADKKYGLGVSDLSRIDVIKLGWQKDVLI